jgi:hypothetical protein
MDRPGSDRYLMLCEEVTGGICGKEPHFTQRKQCTRQLRDFYCSDTACGCQQDVGLPGRQENSVSFKSVFESHRLEKVKAKG